MIGQVGFSNILFNIADDHSVFKHIDVRAYIYDAKLKIDAWRDANTSHDLSPRMVCYGYLSSMIEWWGMNKYKTVNDFMTSHCHTMFMRGIEIDPEVVMKIKCYFSYILTIKSINAGPKELGYLKKVCPGSEGLIVGLKDFMSGFKSGAFATFVTDEEATIQGIVKAVVRAEDRGMASVLTALLNRPNLTA